MKKDLFSYTFKKACSSIFMLLALAWLTISTPFVYEASQAYNTQSKQKEVKAADAEEDTNPFANTTEEKTPNGFNSLSEYLHESAEIVHPAKMLLQHSRHYRDDNFGAFHGELVIPPPEA